MTSRLLFGSKLSLVLCLLLLVPRVGLAAEPAPLRLTEDSPLTASKPSRPSRGLRILAETGAGLLLGTGLGFAGMLAGSALCEDGVFGEPSGFLPCLPAAAGGIVLGVGLGFPLGVFSGGELAGGDGRLYGPLLGMASGLVASVLVAALLGNIYNAYYLSLPFLAVGSIVGYELTERGEPAPQAPGTPAVASARPRLQPVLALSPRGALVGLGGSF
jgi:hypothetical protein